MALINVFCGIELNENTTAQMLWENIAPRGSYPRLAGHIFFPESGQHPVVQVENTERMLQQLRNTAEIARNSYVILTHSPYVLDAIEVYAKKYGLYDEVKFYLVVDGVAANCTHCVEKLYEQMARPIQTLENLRYEQGQNDD